MKINMAFKQQKMENTSCPTTPEYLEHIIKRGFAEYKELKPFIKNVIEKGRNEWGFPMRTLICNDGSNWEYMAEDGIYELSEEKLLVNLN